jgi:hypothetical protein
MKKIFDPIAWANNIADNATYNNKVEMQPSTPPTSSVNRLPTSGTSEQMEALVQAIVAHHINLTEDYNDWLRVGFALAGELGEGGRTYFHRLSQMSAKYDAGECNKKYDNCLHAKGHGVQIETLYWMAGQAGIDLKALARKEGSGLAEAGKCANCATVPHGTDEAQFSKKSVNKGISENIENQNASGTVAQLAHFGEHAGCGYTFSDKLAADDLDCITRAVFDLHHEDAAKCDAMLLAVLNVVGGMMGGANGTAEQRNGVYGVYDGRRVYAPLFNIVYASAGNDKGSLVFARQLAQPLKNEMRRKYEAEKEAYTEAHSKWENTKKGERGPEPQEPEYCDPFVPGNSSSSAVYRALAANGGWGLLFETEADTVSAMIDSDYGNYSDLMRKAHHHETISMNRVTEKLHIDIDEPRLSVFLTCTPGQLPALFPSFENGLGSRFLFYHLPDDEVRFHDVFAHRDTPLEDLYRPLGDKMLMLYHALQARAGRPVQFVLSKAQQQEFLATYRELLQEQFEMLGKGIRAFVFRMALECFRYAMVLTTLRRLTEWEASFDPLTSGELFPEEEAALPCDDRDFRTAMTIVGCLIHHTARVYAVMAKEDDNPFAGKGIHLSKDEVALYKALPLGDFRTSDCVALASNLGISARTSKRILSKFTNQYQIILPVKYGIYSKPPIKQA